MLEGAAWACSDGASGRKKATKRAIAGYILLPPRLEAPGNIWPPGSRIPHTEISHGVRERPTCQWHADSQGCAPCFHPPRHSRRPAPAAGTQRAASPGLGPHASLEPDMQQARQRHNPSSAHPPIKPGEHIINSADCTCCAGYRAQARRLSVVAAASRRDMSLVQRWRALQFGAKDLQRQLGARVR